MGSILLCVLSKFSPAFYEFKAGKKRPSCKNVTLNDQTCSCMIQMRHCCYFCPKWTMNVCFSCHRLGSPSTLLFCHRRHQGQGAISPCSCPNVPLCRGSQLASDSFGPISVSGASAALCSTLKTCCLY